MDISLRTGAPARRFEANLRDPRRPYSHIAIDSRRCTLRHIATILPGAEESAAAGPQFPARVVGKGVGTACPRFTAGYPHRREEIRATLELTGLLLLSDRAAGAVK